MFHLAIIILAFLQLQPKGSAQVMAGPAVTSLHLPQRLFIKQREGG